MKRPSFQFYPSDWLRDTALRTCSCEARGLWMDMICYMHEGTPYGYLKVGSKVIREVNLAVMVGVNLEVVTRLLAELEECGVFSRDEDGCIFSRRMVKDENTRNARAAGGKLGGNPLLVKRKVNLPPNLPSETKDNRKPTPSSSSSSSSSTSSTEKDSLLSDKPDEYPPIVENLWRLFPPNSRLRSSKFKLHEQWRKIKAKPDEQTVTESLTKWASCHEWTKDGGQFAPGAHLWIKDRKWESEPITTNAPNQFRGTNETLSLKIL